MRLRSIPPITSTGHSRSPRLSLNIGIGGFGNIRTSGFAFKPKSIPAKTKKKNKILKIRLFPEEGGFLKMYIEDD